MTSTKKNKLNTAALDELDALVDQEIPSFRRWRPEDHPNWDANCKESVAILQRIEARTVAIVVAARARWQPTVTESDAEEGGPLVFGDAEFTAFIEVVNSMATVAQYRALGTYFGIPEKVLDEVTVQAMTETPQKRASNVTPGYVKTVRTGG